MDLPQQHQQTVLQPSIIFVKSEVLEQSVQSAHQQQNQSTSSRHSSNGSRLFAGIDCSSKRSRTEDWLAPETSSGPLSLQNIYMPPQQQPPMAHTTPVTQQSPPQQRQSGTSSNNGYASPMSSGSYDPYSPNEKMGKFIIPDFN